MPSFEQLKAYLQNPDVALDELKHRYQGALADTESFKQNQAQQNAGDVNKLMPGTTTPEQELARINSAQAISDNIGGVSAAEQLAMAAPSKFGKVAVMPPKVPTNLGKVAVLDQGESAARKLAALKNLNK